jgi:hypothetical protein
MTITQLPLALAQRHNNQQLFSDHYLNATLPQRAEWKLLAHDAGQALAAIAAIVRAYVPSDNEAQTEEELIRPVFRALGHTFEVQAALKTPDGAKKPGYVFYRDLAALNANKNRTLDETAFVEEVRKRRSKAAGKLAPGALRALCNGYAEQAAPVQQRHIEALQLERRLSDLVNQAYGLTPDEVDLLWRTAPPRMPLGQQGATDHRRA